MKKSLFLVSLLSIGLSSIASVTVQNEQQCQHGPLKGNIKKSCGEWYNYNKATKQCYCLPKGSIKNVCYKPNYTKYDACENKHHLKKKISMKAWETRFPDYIKNTE